MRTSGDPASARPPLPLEILITIAEFLEYDARETLLRFSVVCCQFRSAAWAAGLFSEIHIQPLLNVDGSPSVDYESSDYYTDPNAECEPTDYDAPTEDEEYVSLTLKDQWDPRRHIGAFKFLLECLKNTPRMSNAVRSVHVSASSYFDGIMVPPSLLRAVLVQLPNLRDLQLTEVDAWDGPVPDDVLASCPDMAGTVRLEWLDVHRSRVCVPKPHPAYFARILQAVDEVKDLYLWDLSLEVYFLRPAPRSRPLKLSQIRVPDYHSGYTRGRIPNILWMWSQTIDPASLQIITVSPCCRDVVTQLNALLKRCHKLVKIKLNIRRPCCYDWRGAHGQTWTGRPQWNSVKFPDLSHVKELEKLIMIIGIYEKNYPPACSWQKTLSTLRSASLNDVKSIELFIKIGHTRDEEARAATLRQLEWHTIDNMLERRFPSLESFVVKFDGYNYSEPEIEALKDIVKSRCRGTRTKTLLRVESSRSWC